MKDDIRAAYVTKLSGGILSASYHSGWSNSNSIKSSGETIVAKVTDIQNYEIKESGKENLPEMPQTTLGTIVTNVGIATGVGLLQGLEPSVDSTVQALAETEWLANKILGAIFGLVGYEEGVAVTQQAESLIEEYTAMITEPNWSEEWTNAAIDATGTRTRDTNSIVTGVRKIEDTVGSIMISKIPGPWGAAATAATAEGKSVESSYKKGNSFEQTMITSHVAGILAFIKYVGLKGLNSAYQSDTASAASSAGSSNIIEAAFQKLKNIDFKQLFAQIATNVSATLVTNVTNTVVEKIVENKEFNYSTDPRMVSVPTDLT